MKKIEGLGCDLRFGHYEDDEEGHWLFPDFWYLHEITTSTDNFMQRLDAHRLELILQINNTFKRFEKEYEIRKKHGSS